MLNKRRIHAYCVGAGRSGTRSMERILSSQYRTAHEPFSLELITIILALRQGRINKQDFRRYVLHLDNKLALEFNSSLLHSWYLDILLEEFPDAKFIFTIRDCYSWLDSYINHILFLQEANTSGPGGLSFVDMIFGKGDHCFAQEERVLADHGLYTLDGFFSYWVRVNNQILTMVPKSRLLVVKTHEIDNKTNSIAEFLNIPSDSLEVTGSHANKRKKNSHILSKIDKDFLAAKVNTHCKVLMNEFFPDFILNCPVDRR